MMRSIHSIMHVVFWRNILGNTLPSQECATQLFHYCVALKHLNAQSLLPVICTMRICKATASYIRRPKNRTHQEFSWKYTCPFLLMAIYESIPQYLRCRLLLETTLAPSSSYRHRPDSEFVLEISTIIIDFVVPIPVYCIRAQVPSGYL